MSGDSRKDFLLATVANHFGYGVGDGAIAHIQDSRELNNFLDDGNCSLLAAHAELTHDVRLIQVYNAVESESSSDNWLVFFKLQPCAITPDNLHCNVLISSLLDSPVDTLYHAMQKVFAPVFLRDACWSKSVDPKIQTLIGELEAGLGTELRRQGHLADGTTGTKPDRPSTDSEPNLAGVLTPSDEFQYWAEAALGSTKLASRERAQRFQELLQPLATEFANLDALSFADALELVEVTQDALDDLWKQTEFEPPYPEVRMKHLLEVISGAFARFVQRRLSVLDVWTGQYGQVGSALGEGLGLGERWASACESLTVQFWPGYSLHKWKGGAFMSPTLSQLNERIDEVCLNFTVLRLFLIYASF